MAKRTKPPPRAAKPKAKGRRGKAEGKRRPSSSPDTNAREMDVVVEGPGPRWVYGVQPVLEVLKSKGGRAEKIWVSFGRSGTAVQRVLEQAKQQKTPVSYKDRAALDAKAGTVKHQGVLALVSGVETLALDPFLRQLPKEKLRFIALLDEVQDPHNLGAILRTACASGVEGVLLPKHRTSPLTPSAVKASSGAAEWVPLVRVGNAAEALRRVREEGIFVLGADGSARDEIHDQDFLRDVCVVIGGEGKGLRPVLKKLCDGLVSIPMIGPIDSLNASVAAGILFYEVVRQRRREASKPGKEGLRKGDE
jgi:23S rRNA (guanosine2251-2'-O)-methyltransferase